VSVSGVVNVVFVYKSSLKAAAPPSNCSIVEERAMIRFSQKALRVVKFVGEYLGSMMNTAWHRNSYFVPQ
jgi:hypothetical protein